MSIATGNNVWRTTVPESTGNGDYTPCPAGNHPGRICGLFDVGNHPVERTNDKTGEKRMVDTRQLVIVFELSKKQPTGHPFTMGAKYTFSLNEKAKLYEFVKNVTGTAPRPGQDFDPTSLLGRQVMVTVVHKPNADGSKTYANVGTVGAWPEGFPDMAWTITPVAWSVLERTEFPEADWQPFIYGKSIKTLAGESAEVRGYGASISRHSVTPPVAPAPPRVVKTHIGQYPADVQALMARWTIGPGYGPEDVKERVAVANMPEADAALLLQHADDIPF